ncbi:VOC family protein [Paenibacillus physcomitrellae]|uniref:Lactoylglutathione lyase n=1 Tax=Paenibacillus physcomitrellae TaxID=1619311 RepID=A0ABQ1GK29_9BACL|nr:VOC family protein [Paenibacillus physcomitrellae]GGA45159.1 lactoylglutathione lyase [Paenibacillus physcomitrellae]
MSSGLLGTQIVAQIGIIVNDIEKVSEDYARFLGVEKPEWSWTDPVEQAQTEYKGESCPARAKLAFFDCGELQIELIEPDEQPSVWRDFLTEHGEGPHHIAFGIKGMKEKVLEFHDSGFPLLQKGEYTGGRYAYMDTTKELKVLVELLEND